MKVPKVETVCACPQLGSALDPRDKKRAVIVYDDGPLLFNPGTTGDHCCFLAVAFEALFLAFGDFIATISLGAQKSGAAAIQSFDT